MSRHLDSSEIDDSRRERRLSEAIICGKSEPASSAMRRAEAAARVKTGIEELPEDYRTVILLRQQEDLTFEEIARRMERSPDAARMLWGRAILELGKTINRQIPGVARE